MTSPRTVLRDLRAGAQRSTPAHHLRRMGSVGIADVVMKLGSSAALLELARTPGAFHDERVRWIQVVCLFLVGFALGVVVRAPLSTKTQRNQLFLSLVLVAVVGTSTEDFGVLAVCLAVQVAVLASAASLITTREHVALGVVGLATTAALLASQGARGTALVVLTLLVLALCVVPAAMLVEQRRHLEVALGRAEELSRTDPLTGLLNRTGLAGAARAVVLAARPPQDLVGVLVLDVDHFKRINDQHGHLVGDTVLQRLASVLRAVCREEDVVARWGGEELCVVITCGSAEQLLALAEHVRAAVEAVPDEPRTTVSVGVACRRAAAGEDPDLLVLDLLAAADASMYRVKASGRNGAGVLEAQDGAGRGPGEPAARVDRRRTGVAGAPRTADRPR